MRISPVVCAALFTLPLKSQTVDHVVDFRFAPSNSFSLICLPDDWQKSVVTGTGTLGYDFGPGPYARPLTTVGIEADGAPLEVERQWLPDGRIPVVHTRLRRGETTLDQVAFAVIPDIKTAVPGPARGKVSRVGGRNGCRAWANPLTPGDPLFRSVAWGTNRPILYRVTVPRGSRIRVALGFCESYKSRPGSRLLECRIEGSPERIVDPFRSGPPGTPCVEFFDAADENRDGILTLEIHPVQGSDPNVILNAFWLFPDSAHVTEAEVISGRASRRAMLAYGCGLENENSPMRCDALVATLHGPDVTPQVRIQTRLSLALDSRRRMVEADGRPFLICRPAPDSLVRDGQGWKVLLPSGTRHVEVIVAHGRIPARGLPESADLARERDRSVRWWKTQLRFPRSPVTVGDSMIQFLLEANLRNLYQARERVDGFLQFQPGPTVYRGLWGGDVILSGIPALMIGDARAHRLMLETVLRFQRPTGQIGVIEPNASLSETPMAITAMIWYARMQNDEAWLRRTWPKLREGIRWIRSMREATLRDERAPYRGLMPPGFVDGGISNLTADYGSTLWCLTALELSGEAARRLGYRQDATSWQALALEFRLSLDAAMRRDLRHDGAGNLYLPVAVGDTSATPPQRGQYAFLLPLRYGRFLQKRTPLVDSVVTGTLRMLDATRVEGLIANSGWLARGVWPWLGTAHAIACQMTDDRETAIDLLYAVANHASETGTWVEEQLPRTLGTAWTGDASNAEASGMFLHFVRNAFLLERLDTLHCLASVPAEWFRNGSRTEIRNAPTLYGRVSISVRIAGDGSTAELLWKSPRRQHNATAVLHLESLRAAGFRSAEGTPIPDRIAVAFGRTSVLHFRRP